jgi:hypothetical protein
MLVELEWLGYIFMQLFNTARGTLRENSLLEWLCGGSSNERIGYYWLHMLGNYLENMVDKRVTTELVAGYESPIHDVREMYARKEKGVVSIHLPIAQRSPVRAQTIQAANPGVPADRQGLPRAENLATVVGDTGGDKAAMESQRGHANLDLPPTQQSPLHRRLQQQTPRPGHRMPPRAGPPPPTVPRTVLPALPQHRKHPA